MLVQPKTDFKGTNPYLRWPSDFVLISSLPASETYQWTQAYIFLCMKTTKFDLIIYSKFDFKNFYPPLEGKNYLALQECKYRSYEKSY